MIKLRKSLITITLLSSLTLSIIIFPLSTFAVFEGIHTLTDRVTAVWENRYDGTADNIRAEPGDITTDLDGNIYVTGFATYIHGETSNTDSATIKYNPLGQEIWVATYNSPDNLSDGTGHIGLDAQGNIYVGGTSTGGVGDTILIIKYDANSGQELWANRRYFIGKIPFNRDMKVDAAGNVYITGDLLDIATNRRNIYILKYNSLGVEQWITEYTNPIGNAVANAIAIDLNGNVYLTGFYKSSTEKLQCGGTNLDYITIKYSSEGTQQWVATYEGTAEVEDVAHALTIDNTGNIYVTGESFNVDSACRSTAPADFATIKYGANGTELWIQRHSRTTNSKNRARAIAVDESGDIYITGPSSPTGHTDNEDYGTVKYTSQGNLVWVSYYDGPVSGRDFPVSIALDAEGNIYVAGNSEDPAVAEGNQFDYATVKYNPTGKEIWVARYDGPAHGHDVVRDIALSSNGKVYVTGVSQHIFPNSDDWATIKYSTVSPTQLNYIGSQFFVFKGSQIILSSRLTQTTGGAVPGKVIEFLITDGTNSLAANAITDTNGDATTTVTVDLPRGTYSLTASFPGNEDFGAATTDPLNLTVDEAVLDYTGDLIVQRGSNTNLSARLRALETDSGIENKQIMFLITDGTNTLSTQATTDFNGVADSIVQVNLPIGLYTITASFAGDGEVPPVTSPSLDFTVFEPTPGMNTSGGGVFVDAGSIKSFGFSVRYRQGQEDPTGNLSFRDIQGSIQVISDVIEYLVVSGNTARFGGACTVNGEPCTFSVDVTAGGQSVGIFSIALSTGYSASGILTGGNIVSQEN